MTVQADGSILGTIGGGRLEADALRLSGKGFRSGKTMIHSFDRGQGRASRDESAAGDSRERTLRFLKTYLAGGTP
jgi:xanthine dehydrogenase accessory factor